jgi:hypothetical protein
LSKIAHQPPPSALLSLPGPTLNPRLWSLAISILTPPLNVPHHHRKLGRANLGDPDLFV